MTTQDGAASISLQQSLQQHQVLPFSVPLSLSLPISVSVSVSLCLSLPAYSLSVSVSRLFSLSLLPPPPPPLSSCFHSSFPQANGTAMVWSVLAQKAPQACEHLCSAQLYASGVCCACLLLLLLLQRSTAVQIKFSVWLTLQNQMFSRGPLPNSAAWSEDQQCAAMFTDVSECILGRTEGHAVWSICLHSHREESEMLILFRQAFRP